MTDRQTDHLDRLILTSWNEWCNQFFARISRSEDTPPPFPLYQRFVLCTSLMWVRYWKLTLNKNHQKFIKKGPKLTNFLISDRMKQFLSLYLQPFQRYCHQKVVMWALYFPLYRARFIISLSFLFLLLQIIETYRQTNIPFRCSFWCWIQWWKLEVHRISRSWDISSLNFHPSSFLYDTSEVWVLFQPHTSLFLHFITNCAQCDIFCIPL